MNEPSLEQRILEAAEKCDRGVYRGEYDFFHASDIKSLLEAKNVEIAELRRANSINSNEWKQRVESLTQERDAWKRIAEEMAGTLHGCVDALAAVLIESPLAENQIKHMLARGATELKSYDALTGKGEPK